MPNRKSLRDDRKPIDQGYAWLIAAAAGLSFFIGAGLMKSFTLVYEQLLTKFGQTATATALVASLHSGVKMCSSPVVSALVNRFGTQRVTIAGGVIAFIGFTMSAFPPSLYFMYFSHGVVSAIGTNMTYSSAFIMIGQYFVERRGTAMGLATSCSGLGGFSLALVLNFLFEFYGYNSTMLLYAGLTLNYIAVGMIYQPVPEKYLTDWKSTEVTVDRGETDVLYQSAISLNDPDLVGIDRTRRLHSSQMSMTRDSSEDIRIEVLKRTANPTITTSESRDTSRDQTEISRDGTNISSDRSRDLKQDFSECENGKDTERRTWCNTIANQFGLHMLKSFEFVALMFLMFSAFFTFSCSQFLFGLGKEILNLTSSEIALVLCIGAGTEIFIRPISGVLFDLPKIKPFKRDLWLISGICTGLSFIALPFSTSYPAFFCIWISHVITASIIHVHHVGIISDLVGSKNLTSAIGLIRFSMGMGVLIGPILGGMLKDRYDTYVYSFIFLGSSVVVFFSVFEIIKCAMSIRKCI